MKCWKCGTENDKGTKTCSSCGVSLARTKPSTDAGKALRIIFDDFGHEKVLGDPRYIMSSLTDLLPDSELLIYKIEHVYHVGLGEIYEAQIKNAGKPDQPFYTHLRRVLTEDVGFSDSKTDELITYFDEMVGWERPKDIAPAPSPAVKPKQSVATKPSEAKTGKTSVTKAKQSTVTRTSASQTKVKDSEFSSMYEVKSSGVSSKTSKTKTAAKPAQAAKSNVSRPSRNNPGLFDYRVCECGYSTYNKSVPFCPRCGKRF